MSGQWEYLNTNWLWLFGATQWKLTQVVVIQTILIENHFDTCFVLGDLYYQLNTSEKTASSAHFKVLTHSSSGKSWSYFLNVDRGQCNNLNKNNERPAKKHNQWQVLQQLNLNRNLMWLISNSIVFHEKSSFQQLFSFVLHNCFDSVLHISF